MSGLTQRRLEFRRFGMPDDWRKKLYFSFLTVDVYLFAVVAPQGLGIGLERLTNAKSMGFDMLLMLN